MTAETKFTAGEYTMRNGNVAKVCAVNDNGRIVGARQEQDGSWSASEWFPNGHWSFNDDAHDYDIMPTLREWWAAVNSVTGLPFCNDRTRDKVVEYVSHLRGVPIEIIRVREVPDDQA